MNILLTNDDSHISPLFHFVIDKLKPLGDVTIVVPKEEQSWTGKSISRFRPLYLDQILLRDGQAYCVDGTPADCTNLGIHHVFTKKPDLVVSGINIGINAGLGFMLSSGTVGACLEANLAGIPALALSQSLDSWVFRAWGDERSFPPAEVERLWKQTDVLFDAVWEHLTGRRDFLQRPVTWNVNFPSTTAPEWRIVPTFLGHTFYGSCFKQHGDRFHHELDPLQEDTREHADGYVVKQGHVSLTCLDILQLGQSLEHGGIPQQP